MHPGYGKQHAAPMLPTLVQCSACLVFALSHRRCQSSHRSHEIRAGEAAASLAGSSLSSTSGSAYEPVLIPGSCADQLWGNLSVQRCKSEPQVTETGIMKEISSSIKLKKNLEAWGDQTLVNKQ